MLEAIKSYINARFGSRRGLVNRIHFGAQYRMGRFAQYQKTDWSRVDRLIFICHGNICRSPLAEYVARAAGAAAESYGLACGDQFPGDPRAVQFGAELGLDMREHRSRNICGYTARSGDLLVVMEPVHLPQTLASSGGIAQVTLAGLWLARPHPYIHDPFTSNAVFFARCEAAVTSAARRMVEHLHAARDC